MSHSHSHSIGHHHDHHHTIPDRIGLAFKVGIILNIVFTAIEYIVGVTTNSLALVSDATHNLSDVASLVLAWFGLKLAQKVVNDHFTYGYKKGTILASLINSIVLCLVVVMIAIESIERFASPVVVDGYGVIIVAAIGVVINGITAYLFFKDQKKDINIRGAFLHLLVDALVSVGVVVSGVLIQYTGLVWIDPVVSLIIAIIIAIGTYGLLKESIRLVLDGVPKEVDYNQIKEVLESKEEVVEAHHIHIWPISSSLVSLTAHVGIEDPHMELEKIVALKKEIKHDLEHHGIKHATIEFEMVSGMCSDTPC